MKYLILFIIAGGLHCTTGNAQTSISVGSSEWVRFNVQHSLVYKTTVKGDKIMDFSSAGYGGGGVSIPHPEKKITVRPTGGDDTETIQAAIDRISKMKLINGFRGAVLLAPGNYSCKGTLSITSGGVVLRGSGSGKTGTVINITGDPHVCIRIKGSATSREMGETFKVINDYIPSGSNSFLINDTRQLAVGDTILIKRPVTQAWVQFMGMDKLIRNGKKQTWLSGEITLDRIIRKIEKNKVSLDVPLADSFNSTYLNPPGVTVVKITSSEIPSQIGIENFRIESPAQEGTISEGHHRAFTISGISDGWARDIQIFNTVNSISVTGKRITIENINIEHTLPTKGAAKPADLNGSGTQILFNRCSITGDNLFFFGTGAKVTGPVVLLNCIFKGNGWIQPHQRWATGLLVDGCEVPDGGIDFMNRGIMGSGHGWAIGWAVAWNCKAKSFLNQQPPGVNNWVIGCQGERKKRAIPFEEMPFLPEGIYDSHGTPVNPASLYLTQLSERLGEQSLKNIGY